MIRTIRRSLLAAVILTGAVLPGVRGQLLHMDPDPLLSIGGATEDPRYMMSVVVGGLRLADGTVVVADRFTQGLRAYDSEGTFIGEAGGEGEGPGEYEHIRSMGRCSEHPITAFDLHWDLKIYDADLGLVEERSASVPGIASTPYQFACAPSGHWLATGWGDRPAQFREGYYVATAPVVFGRGGEVLVDFGERLSSERIGFLRPDGSVSGSGPHPFGRQMSVAIGRDRLFLGDGGAYRVEVYDFEGERLADLEWDGPDRRVLPAHRETYTAAQLESAAPGREPAMRRVLSRVFEIEEFPAYDRLRTDTDGNLWVRYFPRPGEERTEWVVFTPDGLRVGVISLPITASLLDIGTDYVLVVETDDLDVPTVHLYELQVRGLR